MNRFKIKATKGKDIKTDKLLDEWNVDTELLIAKKGELRDQEKHDDYG